jgi:hypothetical protein
MMNAIIPLLDYPPGIFTTDDEAQTRLDFLVSKVTLPSI